MPFFAIMYGAFKSNHHTNQISCDKIDLETHKDIVDAEEERYMAEEEEEEEKKDDQGNPKDFVWFYSTFFGWLF